MSNRRRAERRVDAVKRLKSLGEDGEPRALTVALVVDAIFAVADEMGRVADALEQIADHFERKEQG